MSNKRLGTGANFGKSSALHLYCTAVRVRIAASHAAGPTQILMLFHCLP